MDFDRSRLALERNLGSFGPWLALVGDDGEGDVRDGLFDIGVVVVGGRVVYGRCRRGGDGLGWRLFISSRALPSLFLPKPEQF